MKELQSYVVVPQQLTTETNHNSKKEADDFPGFRIDGAQPRAMHLTPKAAIKYVTERSKTIMDP
jgi:TPP-dependent pyruvate/acetoin dehydrogenase alpha subunit